MAEFSPRVFLSYGKKDIKETYRIYSQLLSYGATVLFDEESLLGGCKLKTEIKSAIDISKYFIFVLSTRSVSKEGFLNREILDVLDSLSEFPENELIIIPVRLNSCTPSHSFLHGLQWIDLFPDWDKGFFNILRAIGWTGDSV